MERKNIKYFSNHTIMKDRKIIARSINEIIRIVDVREYELEYIKEKHSEYWELIHLNAREVFSAGTIIRVLTKCIYRFNQYGIKDATINKVNSIKEYHYYNKENKDQEHIVKCKENRYKKVEFIK